ncbi:hypothetical protein BY458DRAFT_502825 [Sporodiniella umbellata]|nr:hypothetical protein BY458DRAFT_502825 [Sporodiniella umbellata]
MVTLSKIRDRVTETKWSKLYVSMAMLQCIIIFSLQTAICYLNAYEARLLPESSSGNALISNNTNVGVSQMAADRLDRIIWENIAFISFQVWFIFMVFDATANQNTAEILALAILNAVCAILGALQLVDCIRWLRRLEHIGSPIYALLTAEKIEISLSALILVFAIIMCFLSVQMSKQFGWNIYKKIGADVKIQKMYIIFQFFVLSLKIQIFTGFLVSLFYLIQFALKQDTNSLWKTIIQVVVTVLILPMLYFARIAGSKESRARMTTFVAFQCLELFHFILVLYQTFQPYDRWYTWIVLVIIGILLDITSGVLGGICMSQFGKGLKPFVQRGSNKAKMDLEANAKNTSDNWQIDED